LIFCRAFSFVRRDCLMRRWRLVMLRRDFLMSNILSWRLLEIVMHLLVWHRLVAVLIHSQHCHHKQLMDSLNNSS
jgi:hypothetical protein